MIEIYDTTLRDGAQMRDISFSVADKLKILSILDDFGIQYVEGGWPGANPKDVDFFAEAKKRNLNHTTLTAFGSTRKANTKINEDPILQALLRAETEVICIVSKSSAWQVEQTLRASLEENLEMLVESISYLKANGRKVFVDAEHFFDGYKFSSGYSKQFIQAAIEAKADRMVLCDTNGGSLPEDIFSLTKQLCDEYGSAIGFGIHAHNDGELAVANSLAAVRAGAIQVQGTINGYGERCGNANLISIIPNLQLKYSGIEFSNSNLNQLSSLSKTIADIANMNLNPSQAFVGSRAFTHKGGLHASAIAKDKTSYEHIDPALVGNQTQIVVSEQSGVSNIVDWLKNNDFVFPDSDTLQIAAKEILFRLKDLEHEGYSFENADASFNLFIRKLLAEKFPQAKSLNGFELSPKYFELIENNVHVVNGEHTEATVRIQIAGKEIHSAGIGNGPANALDKALRKALRGYYPDVDNFQLQDFKVRILDSQSGTAARTKVHISTLAHNTSEEWDTIGLSSNIIKASWDAIVDSFEYGFIKFGIKPFQSESIK